MPKLTLALAAALAVGLGAAALFLVFRSGEPPRSDNSLAVAGADIGGPFELTTQADERITSEELIDGPTLVYFGYTFCPDVCPMDVSVMSQATDLLVERGHDVTPVFITIDPARDTPEALGAFAEAMHPEMVALTGSPEEIERAAGAYRVYFEKAGDDDDEHYLMNHSAFTYLMAPDGLRAIFRRGATPEEIADETERVL